MYKATIFVILFLLFLLLLFLLNSDSNHKDLHTLLITVGNALIQAAPAFKQEIEKKDKLSEEVAYIKKEHQAQMDAQQAEIESQRAEMVAQQKQITELRGELSEMRHNFE